MQAPAAGESHNAASICQRRTPSTPQGGSCGAGRDSRADLVGRRSGRVAQEFDVIAAQASVFPKYVTAMKAANSNVRIVAYINGTFDLSSGGTSYPAAWYETSGSGARIRSAFGNYLLDPGNSSWQQSVAQQCSAAIVKSHYD